jgi:hypothetical protein
MQLTSKYDLSKPVNKDGSVKKYVQYVEVLQKSDELTKKEILSRTGIDVSKVTIRGFANKPFKLLKDKKIIKYNRSTKKWSLDEEAIPFLEDIKMKRKEALEG